MASNRNNIFAFISYNHRDVKWAKWLQRKLEWYKLPSQAQSELDTRYIRPVFRDRDELSSGILNQELNSKLLESKYLIVICSANSIHSHWVNSEIDEFIRLGKADHIIPFFVGGAECGFPDSINRWNENHPESTLLGIAVDDDGGRDKHKAFVRVVSSLLNISFDSLWQRHRRRLRRTIVTICLSLLALIMLFYWFAIPIKTQVVIKAQETSLPSCSNAIIYVNHSEYNINTLDTTLQIENFAGYFRLRAIPISFTANRYYESMEKQVYCTFGTQQIIELFPQRDSTFAIFAGNVYDAQGRILEGVEISIEGMHTQTDENGYFKINFDICEQSEYKEILLEKTGYKKIIREKECPSSFLQYVLHK